MPQEGDIVNLDVVCYNEPLGAQGKDARNEDEFSLVRPAQRNFVVLDALSFPSVFLWFSVVFPQWPLA